MKRKISFMSVYWILNYHNQYKHAKYTKNNFPMAITVLGQLPPNPKTNPNLDPSPDTNRGRGGFSSGAIVQIPAITVIVQRWANSKILRVNFCFVLVLLKATWLQYNDKKY